MKLFKHLKSEWFRYGFEALAVVVGILAAFALENWRDIKKQENQNQANKQVLAADLAQDTLQLYNTLNLLFEDTAQFNDFKRRMSSDEVTLDTLVQIARYEFNPWMYASVTFNTNTYSSLKSSREPGHV